MTIQYEFYVSSFELSEEVSIARSDGVSYGANKQLYYTFKLESKKLYKKL